MKYNILSYLIGEGFRNVFKNKKSTGASLFIMCATMIIFGVCFIIVENINNMMSTLESQQGMRVFILSEEEKPDGTKIKTTDEDVKAIGEKIRALNGVNKAEFISKEQALKEMKEKVKDKQDILATYDEDNPFSDSYMVTLTDLEQSNNVVEQINQFEHIKSIQIRSETIEKLLDVAKVIRIISAVILILLVVISIFIIANTIKLSVHARRREISIMKYVGATNGFIRWPFIVEGIIIGIASAILSIILIGLLYNGIGNATYNMFNPNSINTINISLLTFKDMFSLIILVYLALGIGIGTAGSAISMRKYLDV